MLYTFSFITFTNNICCKQHFTGVMRKIGAFIWYQKLHLNGWIQKWSGHTPLTTAEMVKVNQAVVNSIQSFSLISLTKILWVFWYNYHNTIYIDIVSEEKCVRLMSFLGIPCVLLSHCTFTWIHLAFVIFFQWKIRFITCESKIQPSENLTNPILSAISRSYGWICTTWKAGRLNTCIGCMNWQITIITVGIPVQRILPTQYYQPLVDLMVESVQPGKHVGGIHSCMN